jgi:hypothetical protein
MQGIEEGRCLVMPNGAVGKDNTSIGLVRFADYSGMCVPLVCGCVVRDSARFERAHIPLVFISDDIKSFRFEDAGTGGVVRLFENEKLRGEIDVSKKERHGKTWWVNLVQTLLP